MRSSSNIIKPNSASTAQCAWEPPEINPLPGTSRSVEVGGQGKTRTREIPTTGSSNQFFREDFTDHESKDIQDVFNAVNTFNDGVRSWSPQQITPSIERSGSSHPFPNGHSWLEEGKREAQRIIEQATSQANEIIRKAGEQAIQIAYQAYKDGFAEGKEKAEEEAERLLNMARLVLEEAYLWRQEVLSKSERSVIDLVKDIAVKMFGEGIALDPAVLKKAFEKALSEAKTLGYLRLHLHPDDAAALEPIWLKNQMMVVGQQIDLVPDEEIRRGGCFIEGQFGTVDARVETQLKVILDRLSEVSSVSQEGEG